MNKRTRIYVLLAFLIAPIYALAQPAVSKLTVSGGTEITIRGAGFGDGPNVALFQNYGGNSPTVGDWYSVEDGLTRNDDSFSGPSSAKVLDTGSGYGHKTQVFGIPDSASPTGLKPFDEIYISYAVKDLAAFPGDGGTKTSFSTRSSTKDAWLMLGVRGDRGQHELSDPWLGNDIYIPAWTGKSFLIAGNSTSLGFWQSDLRDSWAFGDWNQIFFHASVANESAFFGFANKNATQFKARSGPVITNTRKQQVWDRVKFAPWFSYGSAHSVRLYDEIYVAVGDNAAARVMLGDAPEINKATRLHHAIPVAWTDSEISIDIAALGLDMTNPWYVYVFDSSNKYNIAGIALSEAGESAPLPVIDETEEANPISGKVCAVIEIVPCYMD